MSKKCRMRTPIEVKNRILWDSNLSTDDFSVGYIDRFDGLVERTFDSFNWEDELCDVEIGELAIPAHRIHYFKYCGVIVWNRDERLDYVFGSCGPEHKTITDVMHEMQLAQ